VRESPATRSLRIGGSPDAPLTQPKREALQCAHGSLQDVHIYAPSSGACARQTRASGPAASERAGLAAIVTEAARYAGGDARTHSIIVPSEYAGVGDYLLSRQAHTETSPMVPSLRRMGATCSRHCASRPSYRLDFPGSDARARSDLHSPKEAPEVPETHSRQEHLVSAFGSVLARAEDRLLAGMRAFRLLAARAHMAGS
jgi:hypothetical protein